jgi:renal tumor antigen
MEFNFPKKEGTGIAKLIPHVPPEVTEVIVKLLVYNQDNRMSAGQALK